MSSQQPQARRITLSLPAHLVAFVDYEAARLNTSRSDIIACALARMADEEKDRLAAEGYEFYAQEACEFADACAGLLRESHPHGG